MANKTLTFKYNPEITPEGIFADFWQAAKGKLRLIKPNEISSSYFSSFDQIKVNDWYLKH